PVSGWPLWIGGVAPERMRELHQVASVAGFAPRNLLKRPVRRYGENYLLAELGIDRLAAIEGWLAGRQQHKKRVGVIASFGTALTVDVVRSDGLHLGGVIAPGFSLGGLALNQHTGLLPLIQREILGDAKV